MTPASFFRFPTTPSPRSFPSATTERKILALHLRQAPLTTRALPSLVSFFSFIISSATQKNIRIHYTNTANSQHTPISPVPHLRHYAVHYLGTQLNIVPFGCRALTHSSRIARRRTCRVDCNLLFMRAASTFQSATTAAFGRHQTVFRIALPHMAQASSTPPCRT